MTELTRDQEIAGTILQQLGHNQRSLKSFIGAKHIYAVENGISFQWSAKAKDGLNYCRIVLNGNDLYDIEFWKLPRGIPAVPPKPVKVFNDYYNDMLVHCFEETTGLYLHL